MKSLTLLNARLIWIVLLTLGCGTGGNPATPDQSSSPDQGATDIPCPHELKVKCYDNNPCTEDYCLPNTFECQYKTAPKDGNKCTNGDRCVLDAECSAGVCEVLDIKTCVSSNLCRESECAPSLGTCVQAGNTPFGTPCEDGFACTADDRCESGICVSGTAIECDDNNPCTTDFCNPESGECENTTLNESGAGCDDGNECTLDSCDSATGECIHEMTPLNGSSCGASNLCTNVGTCNAGSCNDQSIVFCGDGEICTFDVCDPETGECQYLTGPANGLTCDDGNQCTDDGKCTNGFCIPGDQKSCNDANPCTQDVCYQGTGCCVNNYYIYDGIACNDGDTCTTPGTCDLGTCTAGTPIPGCCTSASSCDDSNPCTENHCINNQCVFSAIPTSGCCDGDTLKKCMGGNLTVESCATGTCGWNGSQNGCGTDGTEGSIPLACESPQCIPQCLGKECGSDGCGGLCGDCSAGSVCGPAFNCLESQSLEIDFTDLATRNALDPDGDGLVAEFTDVILPNGVQVIVTTDAQLLDEGISASAPFCVQGVWLVMPPAMAYATASHDATLITYNLAGSPSSQENAAVGLPGKISIHTWAGAAFDETEFTEITIPFWSEDGLSSLSFQTPPPLKVIQLHFGEEGTTFQRINID